MSSYIGAIVVGLICIVLGIMNMRGNISSLHSYHRKRVAAENIKPFGRLVGLGTLIIGIAMMIFAALLFAFEKTQTNAFVIIGSVELIAGIIAGTVISFYAMIKYNGGIF